MELRLPSRNRIGVGPLSRYAGVKLLDLWLELSMRRLQPAQRKEVLGKVARTRLPLVLRIALEECRRWHSYDEVPTLGEDATALIDQLLTHLSSERRHGNVLVARTLGYIAAARYGLSEDELLDVLSADRVVLTELRRRSPRSPRVRRLPPVVLSRLLSDLAPYLTHRGVGKTSVLSFFHRQFTEVVEQRHLQGVEKAARHRHLADYFAKQPLCSRGVDLAHPNARKVSELPHHQLHAGLLHAMSRSLVDLQFIEAKCSAGLMTELIEDYRLLLTNEGLPENRRRREVESFCRFVVGQSHVLEKHPALTFSVASSQPKSSPVTKAAAARWRAKDESRPWLKRIDDRRDAQSVEHHCLLTVHGDFQPRGCAFSPDGRRLAVNHDNGFSIRELESGFELVNREFPFPIAASSYTTEGRYQVLIRHEAALDIVDGESGDRMAVLRRVPKYLRCCAVSPDGAEVAMSSSTGVITIRDRDSGVVLRRLKKFAWSLERILFPSTCAFAAVGQTRKGKRGKTIRIWRTGSDDVATTLQLDDWGQCLAFSADGRLLVLGEHETLRVLNAESGAELECVKGLQSVPWSCALSRDAKYLVTGFFDGTVGLWETSTLRLLQILRVDKDMITVCAFSPDGQRIATGSWRGTIKVWDRDGVETATSDSASTEHLLGCTFSPNGNRALSVTGHGRLASLTIRRRTVPHTRTWTTIRGDEPKPPILRRCSYSPDGRTALVTGFSGLLSEVRDVRGTIAGRRVRMPREYRSYYAREANMCGCAYSPDGRWFVTGAQHQTHIWAVNIGVPLRALWGGDGFVDDCSVSPDARLVCSGSTDLEDEYAETVIWNIINAEVEFELRPHMNTGAVCTFSPDGRFVTTAGLDGTLHEWDVRTGKARRRMAGHQRRVRACLYTLDGSFILSFSEDGTVRLWDRNRGPYDGHPVGALSATCAANGLASGPIVAGINGSISLLQMMGIQLGPIATTAVRMYRRDSGTWEDELTARCGWCGKRFAPDAKVVDTTRAFCADLGLGKSPITHLPDAAYDEPRLMSTCPMCERPLRFTPYHVDGEAWFPLLSEHQNNGPIDSNIPV
jgi:WD40 repeat protein